MKYSIWIKILVMSYGGYSGCVTDVSDLFLPVDLIVCYDNNPIVQSRVWVNLNGDEQRTLTDWVDDVINEFDISGRQIFAVKDSMSLDDWQTPMINFRECCGQRARLAVIFFE